MLFIANPAAAGAGLTLHRARFAVYESMSNQAAHYLQSLDRIHRRGQEREVEYITLLCEDTVEVQEYARLTDKERAILGGALSEKVFADGKRIVTEGEDGREFFIIKEVKTAYTAPTLNACCLLCCV